MCFFASLTPSLLAHGILKMTLGQSRTFSLKLCIIFKFTLQNGLFLSFLSLRCCKINLFHTQLLLHCLFDVAFVCLFSIDNHNNQPIIEKIFYLKYLQSAEKYLFLIDYFSSGIHFSRPKLLICSVDDGEKEKRVNQGRGERACTSLKTKPKKKISRFLKGKILENQIF